MAGIYFYAVTMHFIHELVIAYSHWKTWKNCTWHM